jgi:ferric-dicitrate binding protein FerR (iron transport regulator)
MDSPGLTDTRVALLRGEAMVEVTDLLKENSLRVMDHGATTTLLKKGLYEFDAARPRLTVFDGKAQVAEGDSQVELKKGKEAVLNAPLRAEKFDRNAHDDLFNWSNVRSEYLAQAAVESARTYVVNAGGWYGSGWYWIPGFGMYSFIPGRTAIMAEDASSPASLQPAVAS